MAAEGRARALTYFCSYLSRTACAAFFTVAVGQLLGDEHRAGGKDQAVDVLAAHAQEVGIGDAVRLVDLALVMPRDQFLQRRGARRARGADQDGIRIGPR